FTSAGISGQGHPYADFLLGIPTSAARAFAPIERDRNRWQYDLYAIDDFKVSSKLTLNLGFRYELHLPWRENHDLMAMFDTGTGSIVVPEGAVSKVSPLMPKNYVSVTSGKSVGLSSRTLVHPDRNNIAPRIGVAYRPWGQKTVFRGGYGIFYNVVPLTLSIGGVPFVIAEPSYTNPAANPDVILPRVFPASGAGGPSTVGLPSASDPKLKMPYSMQYNFTIERQMWDTGFRISYIGTNERKGIWSYEYNSPLPDTRAFVDKPRPFPNYPGITYTTNGAGHQYNGLTVSAERHFSKGLYFQSSWTWARDRYDMDYDGDLSGFERASENPFDRHREIGVSSVIPTHRVTSNWTYQLPFGKGRHWLPKASRLLNLAAGGWEISGIFSTYSGHFLTPFWTGPDPTGIAFTSSRTPAEVTRRPDALSNPNLAGEQRSITRWYDVQAFRGPLPGQFGSASKGMIKGPGVQVWHLGVHKDFFLQEGGPHLRWEVIAANALNHPNYSNPGTNITSAGNAGVITGVGGVNGEATGDQPGPRALRMALRFEW
ncbi:MAG TPA: hypothetical protein VKE70_33110, partial [Candidatus Solibacter sp.]|nr:hypothetical protein [Candidatus Solibacter sp.]